MIWNEDYRIGVESIDRQHKELFIMTEHLLKHIIKSHDYASRKMECINLILFLKGYSIQHFENEEKYMAAINYCDLEAHRTIHTNFVATVLELEQKMLQYDYSLRTIKEFAGFLTAWLIYHVAEADQKIKTNEPLSSSSTAISYYVNCFAQSASTVLKTMAGANVSNIIYEAEPVKERDVLIRIGLIGTCEGDVVFIFPQDTTIALIKAITYMDFEEVDEIAYSALSEIVNIVSGNAASLISESGRECDIKTPQVLHSDDAVIKADGFQFDTEFGKISIYISLNNFMKRV